ncbi:28S ribosomal protein S15, mitochondrial-like [Amphibalanus amphitrite]|uniref:28S ribosomal protein S15, mitochondrial-like n=1 Tax=Amphibalanus amphitrite TaxID=1232801 RepID=UPI001C92001F|nr:28S ribosomal protein S15, mitochondrial-like [Amphibalanus amphitrite]
MSVFKSLRVLRTALPVINTTQPVRWRVRDVKDVVKWRPITRPSKLSPAYTGDLGVTEPVDESQPQSAVSAAREEFDRSDDVTKRVLSLEFARGVEKTKQLEDKAMAFVQRHRFDTESPEAQIGRMTAKIRRYQLLLQDPAIFKSSSLMRARVHDLAHKRSGLLRKLRATDYRRFEWLLEQLEIVYRPPLPYKTDVTLCRKTSIRRMVQIFCDNIRQEKLDALRRQLDSEKPAFEEERRRACEWIAEEERALGLSLSVDTERGCLLEPRLPKRVVIPPRREQAQA